MENNDKKNKMFSEWGWLVFFVAFWLVFTLIIVANR